MAKLFFRSAILNALKGAGIGLVSIWVLGLVVTAMIATGQAKPTPGVVQRIDIMSLFGLLLGAMIGFCNTRPVPPSKGISLLLTTIAVLGSAFISFMFYGSDPNYLFFGLIMGCIAGFICGFQHFYSPKKPVS